MSYTRAGVQEIEDKQFFTGSVINGAYEIVRDDRKPEIYPEIKLKQGWRNGNIFLSATAPPTPPAIADRGSADPHTYDLWLVVTSFGTGAEGWKAVTATYVLDEGYS